MLLRLILLYGSLCAAFIGCGPGSVEVGEILRPEHPRPDFKRAEWLNLNGNWALQPDREDVGVGKEWFEPGVRFDSSIAVPIETPDSAVAWYRREITAPAQWQGRRVWLRLGAAEAVQVWLDGQPVGEGSSEIALDGLEPGQTSTLTIRTTGAGLTQTTWLEARPAHYIRSFSVTPRREVEGWALDVAMETAGPGGRLAANVTAANAGSASGGATVSAGGGRLDLQLPVHDLEAWSPSNPKLHPLELTLTGPDGSVDRVESYFGLRTVERGRYSDSDYESIMLNGSPIYLRGRIDAGASTRGEMERVKAQGFNFLRIAADADPRIPYWADQIGVLLMQQAEPAVIERNRNHPSILAWSGDVSQARALDPNRLAADAPPHSQTDLNTWRLAPENFDAIPQTIEQLVANTYVRSPANYAGGSQQDGAPLLISAYGSQSAEGRDLSLEFKHLTNLLRRRKAIQGYAYRTELPAEPGYAALLDGFSAASLQGADFIGYLGPPILTAEPGDKLQLQTFVSHFSASNETPTLQATLVGSNDLGGDLKLKSNPRRVRWERYGVTEQQPLPISVPHSRNYAGAVVLELLNSTGEPIAANYVQLIMQGPQPSPRVEFLGPRRLALRLNPGDDTFGIPPQAAAAGIEQMEVLVELATKQAGKVRIRLGEATVAEVELPGPLSGPLGVLSLETDPFNGSYGSLLHLRTGPPQAETLKLALEAEEPVGVFIHGERMGRYPLDPTLILTTKNAIDP